MNGKTITTTTYTMNPKTGEVTPNEPTSVTENPVTKVVKVGAKPKVETNVIPIETTVIEDPTRDFGSPDIVENDGREGKVTITTPYHVNEQTGDVTEGESVEERLDMVRRVVRVGTKRSFIPNDAPKVEENVFTGSVVPNDAPVLEVPEYGGPIGMNGEPEKHEEDIVSNSLEKIVPQEYVIAQKQLDEKISQMNESNVLPNTGSQETNVLAILGGSLMVLVFGFLFKNRKND